MSIIELDPADLLRDERRFVILDGAHNLRDMGGYPTRDGQRVRWGTLFRSDGLHRLGPGDIAVVRGLGLRSVVDLRSPAELDAHGRFPLDEIPLAFIHAPLLQAVWLDDERPEFDHPHDALVWAYREILDTGAWKIAEAITWLSRVGALPAVFHCTAGKDRTGLVAALVLSALGVERQFVLADYSLSVEGMERMRAWAASQPEVARRLLDVPAWLFAAEPSALDQVLDELIGTHGSLVNFLASIGVGSACLGALRAELLEAA